MAFGFLFTQKPNSICLYKNQIWLEGMKTNFDLKVSKTKFNPRGMKTKFKSVGMQSQFQVEGIALL